MYSEKKIEEKCYQLNPALRKAGLVVKVFQKPIGVGYDIAIFKEEDAPAIKEFFLDHIIAETCLKNGECEAWKLLLL